MLGSGCRHLPASDPLPTNPLSSAGGWQGAQSPHQDRGGGRVAGTPRVGTQGSPSSGRADLIKHGVACSSADLDLLSLQPWAPSQGARD